MTATHATSAADVLDTRPVDLTSDAVSRREALPVAALEAVEAAAWGDLVAAAPPELLAASGAEVVRSGRLTALLAPAFDVLAFNRVLAADGDGRIDADDVTRLVALGRARGVTRLFLPWPPSRDETVPGAVLAPAGFRFHNRWVKLWRDAEPPPPVSSPFALRVLGAADRDAFVDVLVAAFDWPRPLVELWGGVVGRRRWHHLGLADGERLVAVAGLFLDGDRSWLGPAATLPSCRGLGAQQELLAHRILLARAAGCRHLAVETAESTAERPVTSMRNARRMGFEIAYRRPNYLLEL